MKSRGVDTGIHWQAGHSFSYFKNCRRGPLDITEKITDEIVSLPLHSKMKKTDFNKVVKTVKEFYA
jgi:dTDP-4-amino-4,6-dideoxygalactose transaminase